VTPTPLPDLRGTLPSVGSTPTVNREQAETVTETPHNFDTPAAAASMTSYTDPALEVREAQDRGVALHLGGEPPPGDKDDDDDGEEGTRWWLWVLLIVGVLVIKSWLGKKQ
jgi:hypothetical protein